MAGFLRRYSTFPSAQEIAKIEGVVIVDEPAPGEINGVGAGVVACVGEFSDMTYAVSADQAGNISTKPQPVEVFSSTDMIAKTGGFDELIGDTGDSGGSGWIAVSRKTFNRLILVPINLASAKGVRLYRKLPSNNAATNPVPLPPMQSGTVAAGAQFMSGTNRVRVGKRIVFTNFGPYVAGVDGNAIPAGLPAATQTFTIGLEVASGSLARSGSTVTATVSAVPSWLTAGSQIWLAAGETNFPAGLKTVVTAGATTFTYTESGSATTSSSNEFFSLWNLSTANNGKPIAVGDAIEIGVVGGASALGTDADTYRVVSVTDTGDIVIERQDGSNFTTGNWVSGAALPWRIHPGSDADSAPTGYTYSQDGGFNIPARPLDATISQGTFLPPLVIPPAVTGSTWDPLSGLTMMTQHDQALTYTAGVQAPNAVAASALDTLYQTALNSLISEDLPARDVNIVYAARHDATINNALAVHSTNASSVGIGRSVTMSPGLATQAETTVLGSAAPGVGANRAERVWYSWPGAQVTVPEASGFVMKGADGFTYTNGLLDTHADGWLAAVCSMINPERNPGEATDTTKGVLQPIQGLQRGVTGLNMGDYVQFKAQGVCALRMDRTDGPIFESGVTSSLVSGQTNINRRRMADFLEDSMAEQLNSLSKQPLTETLKDVMTTECDNFLYGLLSVNNKSAQRISGYTPIDDVSGNTPDLEGDGIFVLISRVQTLATADEIVLQVQAGTNVPVTVTAT